MGVRSTHILSFQLVFRDLLVEYSVVGSQSMLIKFGRLLTRTFVSFFCLLFVLGFLWRLVRYLFVISTDLLNPIYELVLLQKQGHLRLVFLFETIVVLQRHVQVTTRFWGIFEFIMKFPHCIVMVEFQAVLSWWDNTNAITSNF